MMRAFLANCHKSERSDYQGLALALFPKEVREQIRHSLGSATFTTRYPSLAQILVAPTGLPLNTLFDLTPPKSVSFDFPLVGNGLPLLCGWWPFGNLPLLPHLILNLLHEPCSALMDLLVPNV